MTPLAYRITKELTLPPRRRSFVDNCGMLDQMSDLHCFEVTDICDAAEQVLGAGVPMVDGKRAVPAERLSAIASVSSFLPAPKTWIEFEGRPGERLGFLIEQADGFAVVQTACVKANGAMFASDGMTFVFGLGAEGVDPGYFAGSYLGGGAISQKDDQRVGNYAAALNGILAFINSPRIIDRQEHDPHKGLQRKLKVQQGARTDFRINAWSEIKLAVTPPQDAGEDGSSGERLTGPRALHFCRSHLRIRNGRLEMVRSHWRGDPAVGVTLSRYRVVG